MSLQAVGKTTVCGNGTYATLHSVTTNGSYAVIGGISAYNPSGGSLNLTLAIVRQDQTVRLIVPLTAIGTLAQVSFNRGASNPITPITLLSGETLQCKDNGAAIQVTISGLQIN